MDFLIKGIWSPKGNPHLSRGQGLVSDLRNSMLDSNQWLGRTAGEETVAALAPHSFFISAPFPHSRSESEEHILESRLQLEMHGHWISYFSTFGENLVFKK